MDTLIFTDTPAYQAEKKKYTNAIGIMQSVVNAYNAIEGVGNLVTSELNQAFNDPNGLIYDKLTGGAAPVMQGITIDKSKMMSIMVQPTGYPAFIAALSSAKLQLPGMNITVNRPQNFFQITGTTVEISSGLDAQLLEQHRYYTRSTRAEKEKAFIDAVIAAFAENDMDDYYTSATGLDLGSIVNRLVFQNKGATNLVINHKLLNWYTDGTSLDEAKRPPHNLYQDFS